MRAGWDGLTAAQAVSVIAQEALVKSVTIINRYIVASVLGALLSSYSHCQEIFTSADLSPQLCADRVLYLVNPLLPRHANPAIGPCKISVAFRINASGKIGYPLESNWYGLESNRNHISASPENCRATHAKPVIKALRKAQFAAADETYDCIYTHVWRLE